MAKILLRDCGRLSQISGYSTAIRATAYYLDKQGHDVYFNAANPRDLKGNPAIENKYKETLLRLAKKVFEPSDDTWNITMAPPYSFRRLQGLNIGLTMTERPTTASYWDKFDWVGLCNSMDFIFTPSEWNKKVFEDDGIENVHVLEWGVSSDLFVPPKMRDNKGDFKFLTMIDSFSPSSRDEWEILIQTYNRVFHNVKDVSFTIINRRHNADLEEKYSQPHYSLPSPRIYAVSGDLQAEELMQEYYWTHDCFVKYSREGWGLPVLEAMACGMQVIHNGNTGQTQYLTGKNALVFNGGKFGPEGGSLVDGDIQKLEKWMMGAYQGEHREVCESARATAERLDWSNFANNLVKSIEKITAQKT